jgi:hypothetical protein
MSHLRLTLAALSSTALLAGAGAGSRRSRLRSPPAT